METGTIVGEEEDATVNPVDVDNRDKEHRHLRGDVGEWYILGGQQELLQTNCAALRRQFHLEDFSENSALRDSLDECVYHARQLKRLNEFGSDWTFTYSREVEKWCALAALFLRTRIDYQLLKNCPEKLQEGVVKEPVPKSFFLKRDWFQNGVDALIGSQEALHQECYVRGIEYRTLSEEYDNKVLLGLLAEGNKIDGKKHWRDMAVSHLRKLVHFTYEASWK